MLIIENYSDKSFAIFGDTKEHKEELKKLGCKYNSNLKGKSGWIFSNSQRSKVQDYVNSVQKDKETIKTNQIKVLKMLQQILYDKLANDDKIEYLKNIIPENDLFDSDVLSTEDVFDTLSKNVQKYFEED